MNCRKCGTENQENAIFCENCGAKLNQAETTRENVEDKKPSSVLLVIGYIFAFLGGLIGIVIGAYMLTRKNPNAKSHGRNMLVIAGLVLILSFTASALALNNFQDDIDEKGAINVVNMYIDKINEQFPDEENNFKVGAPQRVKVNGIDQWKVPVIYTGNNPQIIAVIPSQNGYIMVPVKGTKNNDGTITISIKLPNGQTLEVIIGSNGLDNIRFPDGILISEDTSTTSTTDTSTTDTSTTGTTDTSTSNRPYCHICESYDCVHITRYGETSDSFDG